LNKPGCYERLEHLGTVLTSALSTAAASSEASLRVQQVGSMLTPFFQQSPVRDEASAKSSDTAAYAQFFHGLLDRGVYPPPSPFETWFVSLAHTDDDIAQVASAATQAFGGVNR